MEIPNHFLFFIITNLICIRTSSSFDPRPTQDFCIADPGGPRPCKDRFDRDVRRFLPPGPTRPGDTNNSYNASFKAVSVLNTPGFNAMGFTMARLDLGRDGFFPPHFHPRASELHVVREGCLRVGFVAPDSSNYTHYGKNLTSGDVFLVPVGLVHYQISCGTGRTSSYAVLNSMNPGLNYVTRGANPPMDSDYLGRAYKLDRKIVEDLEAKDWV